MAEEDTSPSRRLEIPRNRRLEPPSEEEVARLKLAKDRKQPENI